MFPREVVAASKNQCCLQEFGTGSHCDEASVVQWPQLKGSDPGTKLVGKEGRRDETRLSYRVKR